MLPSSMILMDSCITDVSAQGNVHVPDSGGSGDVITDVSALGGVHTRDLCGCKGITDVCSLGKKYIPGSVWYHTGQ